MDLFLIYTILFLTVLNMFLLFLALAAIGRQVQQGKQQFLDLTRLALGFADAVCRVEEKIDSSLDCLVTCDARLSNSEESGSCVR